MKQFKDNLKRIRKEKGLNQTELAKMIDVTRQSISNLERGEFNPSYQILLKLSMQLGVSLDELMGVEV